MATIESSSGGALLADTVDQVEASHADAGGSVEVGVLSAGRSCRFALADVGVEDVAVGAGLGWDGGTSLSVPVGSCRAGGAGVGTDLEESIVASAADSVEVGVGGAGGERNIGIDALSVFKFEARVADAGLTVVVGVGWASGDPDTLSSQELGSINADAGLEGSVVAFVLVAVGSGSAEGADSVDVPDVSEVAFAGDTVECLIGSALSASTKDPEVSFVAVAFSVSEVAVDTTVLVAAAAAVDDGESRVADTAARFSIGAGVGRAEDGADAFTVVEGEAVVALASSVDVGLVGGADGVAEAVLLDVARLAEALVGVTVVVVAGVAPGADSSDPDVLWLADAGLGGG